MKKTDTIRVKTPPGHRLCAGCTRRRAGLAELQLPTASSASGTDVTGTTNGPLDGGALIHGVDAHAGEGASSSTAVFHLSGSLPGR
jgi:hypothetical protein